MRTEGCISAGRWDEAERIIDIFSEEAGAVDASQKEAAARQDADALRLATEAHLKTRVPQSVRRLLLKVLQELLERHGINQKNSLFTDRTFLVKMLRVMRAKAVLAGRLECTPEDISVLRYLTTFRIPEAVHKKIDSIIHDVINTPREDLD